MRVVLDPNVVISALISPGGSPARVLARGLMGDFELVTSRALIDELATALTYPKLRKRVTADEAAELVDLLLRRGHSHADAVPPPDVGSRDPSDDYLIGLAAAARALLVTGDDDLLALSDQLPIYSPAAFLEVLGP